MQKHDTETQPSEMEKMPCTACPERATCLARSGLGTSDYMPQLEKGMLCVLGEIRFVGLWHLSAHI